MGIKEDKVWYIAYTKSFHEKKAAEILAKNGVEHYLPIRKEIHKWSDRNKIVERIVLPHILFIRCTFSQRIPILKDNPHLTCYMSVKGPYTPAIVKDNEMELFRSMVEFGGNKFGIKPQEFAPGDRVRVLEGPLKGKECELVGVGGERYIIARLSILGAATIQLDKETIEKIN